MAEQVILLRVFLSGPSDVVEETDSVGEILDEWNLLHGDDLKARLELVHWKTHTHPDAGARPQALINKQAFDRVDIIIAIFRRRFGSPTGKFDSGTQEEVERGIKQGKTVMVYFGEGFPRGPGRPTRQEEQLRKFKDGLKTRALIYSYADQPAFAKAFRQHLAQAARELVTQLGPKARLTA